MILFAMLISMMIMTPSCNRDKDNHLSRNNFATRKSTPDISYSNRQQNNKKDKPMYNELNPDEKSVIINKATEKAFSGKFEKHFADGIYICRQCNQKLFTSKTKFDADCGWPSFDDQINDSVIKQPDIDGRRTEIICSNCSGHLGHIFNGEGFTKTNNRYCVNSISLDFIPKGKNNLQTAIFASGCFWGTEYHFAKVSGVIKTTSGFIGGDIENPSYKEVSSGKTNHIEAVEIVYDPLEVNYRQLLKLYFETHDFTQTDGQGPDIGSQYISVIFYTIQEQKEEAESIIKLLTGKGYKVATELREANTFYPAEEYHQDYYKKNGKKPYCHIYKKIF